METLSPTLKDSLHNALIFSLLCLKGLLCVSKLQGDDTRLWLSSKSPAISTELDYSL